MSITGGSFVKDEAGNEPYIIKGKFFSITRKKQILDKDGNLLYVVCNKLWNFFNKRAYIYNADGEKVLTLLKKGFKIENKFLSHCAQNVLQFLSYKKNLLQQMSFIQKLLIC